MDNVDPVGIWFQEFEKRHECSDIIVGIYQDDKSLETRLYPHARYDGVSILLSYLAELDLADPDAHLPCIPRRSFPGFARKLKSLIVYLVSMYTRAPSRKMKTAPMKWPVNPVKVEKARTAWRIFDEVHSNVIVEKARGDVNSYILSKLIPHTGHIWAKQNRKISVCIPVSLHNTLAVGQAPFNMSSLVAINLDESTTGEEINRKIKCELTRNMHLGAWLSLHVSRYVGPWYFDYVLTNGGNLLTHSLIYSNLGRWSPQSKNAVFFIPPVNHSNPVCTGILSWGNKISIAIQTHPHMKLASNTLEDMVDNWSANLIENDNIHYWASSRTTDDLNLKAVTD